MLRKIIEKLAFWFHIKPEYKYKQCNCGKYSNKQCPAYYKVTALSNGFEIRRLNFIKCGEFDEMVKEFKKQDV